MSIQKIHFITASFPPLPCGVGDYTAYLAAEVAKRLEVKILTAYGNIDKPLNVKIEQIFNPQQLSSIFSVIEVICSDMPDWVILQYNPFSYRYGFNPYIPLVLNIIKYRCPKVKIGIVFHECFIPIKNWKSLGLSAWLQTQQWELSRIADVVFLVIQPWVSKVQSWFRNKTVEHLPVSSNMPLLSANRDEIRLSLGISSETIVFGLFGRIQRTCKLQHIINAVKLTQEAGFDVLVLYVGLNPVGVRSCLGNLPLLADGPLSPHEISRRFAAMDIYLMPINEGISTRRTSLMTGLQHGVPTVATFGEDTDAMLMQENGKAFILADVNSPDDFGNAVLDLVKNSSRRKLFSEGGQEFFSREFTWDRIAMKFLNILESCNKVRESR